MTFSIPRIPLAARYENSRHPRWVLAVIVILLYIPSLFGGFMIDDLRCLRVLQEYKEGQRDRPGVYEFLIGDESNAAERLAGSYPWWMGDNLKYRHFRPTATYFLYGEFLLFGDRPLGYHVVSLILYLCSVLVVIEFFRMLSLSEVHARWAALIFAIMASHTIPVMFVSAQCDLLALLCVVVAMLLLGRFYREGRFLFFAIATLFFLVGLGAKEAVLPVAASPLIFWTLWRREESIRVRVLLNLAIWLALGIVWLMWYSRHGYGSNSSAMLDPTKDLKTYLLIAPWRALLLLCTWVVVTNPFMLEMNPDLQNLIWIFALIGGATLLLAGAILFRSRNNHPEVVPAALWAALFLPVLVCTPPDDRVMMLPSIGLALLAAVWMRRDSSYDGTARPAPRFRKLPFFIFVLLQPLTVLSITGIFNFMEWEAQHHLKLMAGSSSQPISNGDCFFMLNTTRTIETLFTQDRLIRSVGPAHAAVLCDVPDPTVTKLDDHTLRLESSDPPLFSTFLGRMGTPRDRPHRLGDVLHAREFTARIAEIKDGAVRAVELTFKDKLDSKRYRFYMNSRTKPPVQFFP